jgi:phenylalanyl-tRNA synthetase alpha chain
MGFEIVEGPEIENEWYNFDALNIPKDHPARDLWNTFWLKSSGKERFLLRAHTSPVQIHYMETHNPPLRIIAPGNVFRHEATDARHEFQLFQIEGLMVDRKISISNLKAILEEFFKKFFGKDIDFKLDPDFFPFTEPSFNVSVTCVICGGKGCDLCKKSGYLEVAGAGMVHPNVFKNAKLNPKEWRGWAFGFGLERLAMLKYKINDIRLFRSGDLRFINQF